ncbi:complement decay-accelerating factor isoform X4 [Pipistrellus kuhlii]|uniref:complement decay-accelerating factor isoform X4 n=1 Tax=Pipistrellus kuhlii TaxID=59472 RepID=UPI001E272A17|nr:complement decay-accelerating factor isoform X4 [Pipistrellus kuhlii]
MRPARSGAPRWLPPALLLPLLLCCPLAARGDCGLPPDMPGATAQLEGRTAFPAGARVGYYCNEGFAKIIGKVNVVHCLPGGEWTRLEVFCQRSCGITPSVLYGHKKDIYIPVSSHPAGFVVEYECNPGYARNHSVSANITCLQNYTWSKPEIFCYKRSCPDPGKIENGHIRIPTDILFTSYIYFSCDPGYKLVGKSSTSCYYEGNDMIWDDPFPKCQEIPTTPQTPTTMDAQATQNQTVFTPPSTSRGSGLLTAVVTITASALITSMRTAKHSMLCFMISQRLMPQKYVLVNDKRKHIYDIDSFAYDAGSHWLHDLAKEEIRRKCIQVHRIS